MIVFSEHLKKEFKRLCKRYRSLGKDLEDLINILNNNPCIGIDLGNGIRKIRLAISSKAKGKSSGARVISYSIMDDGNLILLTIYDKSE